MKTAIILFIALALAVLTEARVLKAKSEKAAKIAKGVKSQKSTHDGEDSSPPAPSITEEMIMAAQDAWGEGIVRISAAYKAGGNYERAARNHIRNLYAYGMTPMTPVLFKPTLAAEKQFRSTFAGALSYFIGTSEDNDVAPEDKGFAIKGWTNTRFENEDIFTEGRVGEAMGNYFFTKEDGSVTKVEYSFGYILDDEGAVRINLHHSSLPYSPPAPSITEEMIMAAQDEWGEGIVRISAAHKADEDFVQVAENHISTLYAYGMTKVLFKPTLAADQQFRSTFAGALSYFVASNGVAPEDTGFAIKGWTNTRFENVDILTEGKVGSAMGNYFFTKEDGSVTKVEYSFGYFLDEEGDVRINLHHSSLPYAP